MKRIGRTRDRLSGELSDPICMTGKGGCGMHDREMKPDSAERSAHATEEEVGGRTDGREDLTAARDADGMSVGTAGGSASGQEDGSPDENGAGGPDSDALGTLRAESAALREELERIRDELGRAKKALAAAEADKGRAESERDEALRREGMRIREAALRRYLDGVGLSGDAAGLAMRGLKEETEALCLDEDGGLAKESREALDGLMEGPFRPLFRLVGEESGGTRGIALSRPPLSGGIGSMSREEILAIRDGEERRRAIAENPGAFGL